MQILKKKWKSAEKRNSQTSGVSKVTTLSRTVENNIPWPHEVILLFAPTVWLYFYAVSCSVPPRSVYGREGEGWETKEKDTLTPWGDSPLCSNSLVIFLRSKLFCSSRICIRMLLDCTWSFISDGLFPTNKKLVNFIHNRYLIPKSISGYKCDAPHRKVLLVGPYLQLVFKL